MRIGFLFGFLTGFLSADAQVYKEEFPPYNGADLGLTYSPKKSFFKIWAPTATKAQLKIYLDDAEGNATEIIPMKKSGNGTWVISVNNNIIGKYYSFNVEHNGVWLKDVPDPYAKAVGTNGKRAMVIDLKETNPQGWENDSHPILKNKTNAIIYELHVRDASIATNSGIKNKGKFIGLAETGTKNNEGFSTGLDHIKDLGVTHVHLLPVFDYNSNDEAEPNNAQYNWGYDPLNYNTPEGSYSTNAADGNVRIKEFKEMVKTFHNNGLSVVMDVVYNHTGVTEASNFNQLVPGYYYRKKKDGTFSNASGCGNETASEKYMMRKFMIESLIYWVKEYHIDGFRFDLMGIHDIETMNQISAALHKINPSILLYGEGWASGNSPIAEKDLAVKKNVNKLDRIAVFSDDIRDAIKGSVFNKTERGFASGKNGLEESIKFGIVASCKHKDIDYADINHSKKPYANEPWQTITYAECHDNHSLWDRLLNSNPEATNEERIAMHKLSLSIILTSQGISFLHAGSEFLRNKKGVENSYNASDAINEIDWSLKSTNNEVYNYIKGLVHLRKQHPAFRMATAADMQNNLLFNENLPSQVIGYELNGAAVNDSWKKIKVLFNGSGVVKIINLQEKGWISSVENNFFSTNKFDKEILLQPHSCSILYKK